MEALYHEVPILAIPFFGDQDENAAKATGDGWCRGIKVFDITEEKFTEILTDLLNNKTYREKVKELSEMYRGRLNGPLESAVFWVEYVIKYHGAPHLSYSGKNLNFFQTYSLDVIAVIVAILYVLYRVVKASIKFVWRKIFARRSNNVDQKKKRN